MLTLCLTLYYVDADILAVAFDGTRLYRLARLVSAAPQLDMEGDNPSADDGSVSAVVCRFHAYDRPYAHAVGNCNLRNRYVEHHHPALSLHAVSGARPWAAAASAASYLILS